MIIVRSIMIVFFMTIIIIKVRIKIKALGETIHQHLLKKNKQSVLEPVMEQAESETKTENTSKF